MGTDSVQKSEIRPDDEPLFVLKYASRRQIIMVLGYIVNVLIFAGIFSVISHQNAVAELFFKAFAIFLLYIFIYTLFDTVLCSEIRLYGDRITKVWHLIGLREVRLEGAKLADHFYLGSCVKTIADRDANPNFLKYGAIFFPFSKGISYNEMFALREDVDKMNELLAELSGRKVENFEGN
jgi:hypothetical protein